MKPAFRSSNVLSSLVSAGTAYVLFFAGRIDGRSLLLATSIIAAGFLLSRVIFKMNRGLTYSGHKTREFYGVVANYVTAVLLLLTGNVDGRAAVLAVAAVQALYSIGRGFTAKLSPQNKNTTVLLR